MVRIGALVVTSGNLLYGGFYDGYWSNRQGIQRFG